MSSSQGTPGKTRICPHCKATILQSASVCPVCRKSLRWEPYTARHKAPSFSALRVDGRIRHPAGGESWEYSVLLSIHNDRGEEISRHLVGVGALKPEEQRTFTLSVEVFTAAVAATAKR